MRKICYLFVVFGLLLWGCSISDEDRCPDGYEYLPEDQFCYKIVDGGDGDSGPIGEENFGQECSATGNDCEGGQAEVCLERPGSPGFCSYADCDERDPNCPDGYYCADCTKSPFPEFAYVVCLPDDWSDSGFIQTNCEW